MWFRALCSRACYLANLHPLPFLIVTVIYFHAARTEHFVGIRLETSRVVVTARRSCRAVPHFLSSLLREKVTFCRWLLIYLGEIPSPLLSSCILLLDQGSFIEHSSYFPESDRRLKYFEGQPQTRIISLSRSMCPTKNFFTCHTPAPSRYSLR